MQTAVLCQLGVDPASGFVTITKDGELPFHFLTCCIVVFMAALPSQIHQSWQRDLKHQCAAKCITTGEFSQAS